MLLPTLTLTLLAVLALGFWVVALAPGRRENQVFAAFSWLAALWVANDLFFWGFAGPEASGAVWAKTAFLVAIGLQLSFLAFSWVFPRPRPVPRAGLLAVLGSAALVGGLVVLGEPVADVGFHEGAFRLRFTPLTFAVGAYVYGTYYLGRVAVVRQRRAEEEAGGDARLAEQLRIVQLAPLLTGAITTTAIVVLPLLGVFTLLPYASLGILTGALLHAYALWRLRFLSPASELDEQGLFPVTAKLSLAVAGVWALTLCGVLALVQLQLGGSLRAEAWQRAWVYALVAGSLPALLLILLVQRILTRPLRELSAAALAVAGGRTDVRVALPGGARDEVALLAESFNEMVARLEQDLESQRETASGLARSERLAVAGSLAAGVAHEVNNPLAAISSLVQSAQGRAEDPRARELLDEALGHMERISRALRDLLDFARPPGEPVRAPCSLNAVVERALRLLRYDKGFKRLELEVALDPALPVALADPDQLQQVVLNLLFNARDAIAARRAAEPQASGMVRVATEAGPEGLLLRVRDTGTGIAPEHLERLTEPFFTTKPAGAGTGLGLAVCRDLLRAHGGKLTFASEVGQGTEALAHLPRAEGAP
ncbi:MAG: sensor histidine kinase [Planctomycetota bacterium]